MTQPHRGMSGIIRSKLEPLRHTPPLLYKTQPASSISKSRDNVLTPCYIFRHAPKLAFMTVGILRESFGHAQVQGFVDRIPKVYRAADTSDGFHARSIRDVGTWLHSWGEVELPVCFPTPPSKDHIAMTPQPLAEPGVGGRIHLPRTSRRGVDQAEGVV